MSEYATTQEFNWLAFDLLEVRKELEALRAEFNALKENFDAASIILARVDD